MNRMIAILCILAACCLALTACGETGSPASEPEGTSSTQMSSIMDPSSEPTESDSSGVYPPDEPPLSEGAARIPVPDFLDEEQQLTYRRAYDFYLCFRMSSSSFEYVYPAPEGFPPLEPAAIESGHYGWTYYQSTGRYRTWADFEKLALSICTEDYFNELNSGSEDTATYIDVDGLLYHVCGDRGGNIERNDEPETFELVSRTEDRIEFNIIGYYYDMEKYTEKEWLALPWTGQWDYTKAWPVAMEKTDAGWRIDEYNVTF